MEVYAIIPAHNEEEGIEEAILSIVNQTYKVQKILIACDNCNDGTEAICNRLSKSYQNVYYFSTFNNAKRKSGALNQAFSRIKNEKWDFLIQMDADSVLHRKMVEEAIKEFSIDPNLGGICSRFRTRDYTGGNYLLYTLQYLEYSFFDSMQVEKRMNTHVLSGTASVLRRTALDSFDLEVWDEDSIVEDYALTLELKEKGWKVRVGSKMHITTDYMHTLKDLWKQRRRWIYGTAEELLVSGWNQHTKRDIMIQFSNLMFGFFQVFFIASLIFLAISGRIEGWHSLGIAVPLVVLINKIYRSKYIKKKSFFNLFLANSLIPEYIYSLFLIFCMFSCYFRLLFRMQPKW